MQIQTTFTKDIRTADKKAQCDEAAKNLLANRMILAWILKSCATEFRDIELQTIASHCIIGDPLISQVPVAPNETNAYLKISGTGLEDATITEGTVTFDIRFQARLPADGKTVSLIVNVEAQNDFYPGYPLPKRGIYYCSRMISSQYGTVFTKSHYEEIKKVYSIWICTNPSKSRENTITSYSITEHNIVGNMTEQPKNYDLLTTVMICLGNPKDRNDNDVLKLLGVLLSTEIPADDKLRTLERDFHIPATEKLERTVSNMCNISDGIMAKGMEKGSETALTASIKSLMNKLKMTAEQAMDALSIPESDYAKYMELMKKEPY